MCAFLKDAPDGSNALDTSWIKTPYGLKLKDASEAFKTLLESEQFVMELDDNANGHTASGWMNILQHSGSDGKFDKDKIVDEIESKGDVFYSRPNYTDTRVGGNDAINPYWQFNIDDDIVPPTLAIEPTVELGHDLLETHSVPDNCYGMGRVYSEVYDANQQILWLSMGVPEYTSLMSFYADAGDEHAAQAMNRGTLKGIKGTLINYIFKPAIWAISAPVMAPFWINRWMTRIQSTRVCKYFSFKPAMVLYYEMVNTMLSYLAVSMGIYPQFLVRRHDSTKVLTGQYQEMQFAVDPTPPDSMDDPMYNVSKDDVDRVYADNGQKNLEQGKDENAKKEEDKNSAENIANAELLNQLSDATKTEQAQDRAKQVSAYRSIPREEDEGNYADTSTNRNDAQVAATIQALKNGGSGIPDLLRYGPDIFSILNRRVRLFNAGRVNITNRMLLKMTMNENQTSTDGKYWTSPDKRYEWKDSKSKVVEVKKSGSYEKFWTSLKANVFGAGDFVGFRVEKGLNTSENVSNTTGQLGIAQKLNSYAEEQRSKYEDVGNSWIAKTAKELAKDPQTALSTMLKEGLAVGASGFGLGDIGAILTNGNGFVDIPEVWKGSSFSRSYSFNINLRARYGDPVSIYQSIYIPLCMLICAAMPRSIGNAMYTSPFLVKAYCKGMFSVPCGIITGLDISRGTGTFGWSNTFLPTAVDVSVQIKDLSPAIFISMQDIGLFDTFSRNDNLMEYLDTLSALGITERLYGWPKVMRKLTAALLIKRNTIFNSNYWSMRLGRTNIPRAIARITPFANHEKSDAVYQTVNR